MSPLDIAERTLKIRTPTTRRPRPATGTRATPAAKVKAAPNTPKARFATPASAAAKAAKPVAAVPAQPAARAGAKSVSKAAPKSMKPAPVLVPATPETTGKTKAKRRRLSKAFPMPLEDSRKKARKKELKRVLKALQALAEEGMVSGRYTLPGEEYAQFVELRRKLEGLGVPAKKNQLLRAGLQVLSRLPQTELIAALAALPTLPDAQDDAATEE